MANEIIVNNNNSENTYNSIRHSIITAQQKVYTAVNSAMVFAYWEIGEQIYKACGDNDRSEYGKNLIKYLSDKLTLEFGKGFSETNLRSMRKFYLCFPIQQTLSAELSWSHYQKLMRIDDPERRKFYTEECIKFGWSVRQLDRQINSFFYERLLSSKNKASVSSEIEQLETKPEYEKIRAYILKQRSVCFLQRACISQPNHSYQRKVLFLSVGYRPHSSAPVCSSLRTSAFVPNPDVSACPPSNLSIQSISEYSCRIQGRYKNARHQR